MISLKDRETRARLKGGRIVHVLALNPDGTAPKSGALCGASPSQGRYSSMARAGWYGLKDYVAIDCPKCLAILNERNAQ